MQGLEIIFNVQGNAKGPVLIDNYQHEYQSNSPIWQFSPSQPSKHRHSTLSSSSFAVQLPLLLQGWAGRVQGVSPANHIITISGFHLSVESN